MKKANKRKNSDVSKATKQAKEPEKVETTSEVAPETVAGPVVVEEFQHPTVMPADVLNRGRSLDVIGHEWAEQERAFQDKKSEKDSVVKDYNKAIGVLEARCGELAQEYREAEQPITYDHVNGWKYVWDGVSRSLIRKEKLGPGTIPLPGVDGESKPKGKGKGKGKGAPFDLVVGLRVWWPGSGLHGRITASDDSGYLVEYEDTKDADGNSVAHEPAKLQVADFADANPMRG